MFPLVLKVLKKFSLAFVSHYTLSGYHALLIRLLISKKYKIFCLIQAVETFVANEKQLSKCSI